MNIVDLFSGCGGFALGAHKAGLGVTLAIDADQILTSSYTKNFPKAELWLANLASLDPADIRRKVGGPIDGIFGGPPCQAFSNIGQRVPTDPRRKLMFSYFRIVAAIRPTFFVFENVPGLGAADTKNVLDRCLDMVANKYKILGPLILDAADFGAATRRRRIFVVGVDLRYADPVTEQDIELKKRPHASVQAAIYDLRNATYLRDERGFDIWKLAGGNRLSEYARGLRSKSNEFSGHIETEHTREVVSRFKKVRPGKVDSVGRHPRLAWDGLCPTLRAGTGSERGSYQSVRPIHPDNPRVITVREAARLQGFPDSFRFHPTIWHSFRMIGNSVSPIISKAIFSAIAKRIEIPRQFRTAAE